MLDKTLPYRNIIMKRYRGTPVPTHPLPSGYAFRSYQSGDEFAWADILFSVGEFDTREEALKEYREVYLPHPDELARRSLFIVTDGGEPVGTLTNWWNESAGGCEPSVPGVGGRPGDQGLGLGKALVFEGMARMIALEGDRDFFLHTQTWSHRAVNLYLAAGYRFVRGEAFGSYENETELALAVIRDHIQPRFRHLLSPVEE